MKTVTQLILFTAGLTGCACEMILIAPSHEIGFSPALDASGDVEIIVEDAPLCAKTTDTDWVCEGGATILTDDDDAVVGFTVSEFTSNNQIHVVVLQDSDILVDEVVVLDCKTQKKALDTCAGRTRCSGTILLD